MRYCENTAIKKMSERLDCDYPFALGLYLILKELDKTGQLDTLSDERLIFEFGFLSQQTSRKYSQKKREEMCEIYRETQREIKREEDRERQREYYQRKRRSPSSPLPSTPPIPPISPQEKEIENAPLSLRDRPPEGVSGEKPKLIKRFRKPTVDEIKAYALEIDYNLDAESFYDYYESNGWRAGKNPMKDWKATVRNWKRHAEERGINTHVHRAGPAESDEDLWADFTEEQRELYKQLANDPANW